MQSSTKQKKDYKKGKKSRNIKEKLVTKKQRAKEQQERITRCYYFSFIYNSFCLIYYAR